MNAQLNLKGAGLLRRQKHIVKNKKLRTKGLIQVVNAYLFACVVCYTVSRDFAEYSTTKAKEVHWNSSRRIKGMV